MRRQRRGRICLCLIAAALFLAGCNSGGSGAGALAGVNTAASARLIKAPDAQALEKRLKTELVRRYETDFERMISSGVSGGGQAGTATTGQTSGTAAADGSGAAHSETNVQEQGVDEGDLVKTDGNYIYLARGTRFLILDATSPEHAAIISDTDLQEPVLEIELSGTQVAVISNPLAAYPVMTAAGAFPVPSFQPSVHVSLYDVSLPAAPNRTAFLNFPGRFQGSRRINGMLYLVTNYSIVLPDPAMPSDFPVTGGFDANAFFEACRLALEENIKRIQALSIADLLPVYTSTLSAGSPSTVPLVSSRDVYYPESANGTDLSLVVSLDMSGAAPAVAATGVMTSWPLIYMTTENLYLASANDWLWIEPAAGSTQPPDNPKPRTAIHKFCVSGENGRPAYRASGMVDGWLNDRFSMGEYQGRLRIGTTVGGWWGGDVSNQLAVLGELDGRLVETGKITGLAPGERTYSMRFDGDRGYLVTFRQIDPLFTFDLSDPANPKQAGRIDVSGVATYLQVLGADRSRLLTIGRSADATGRVTGNKLQLFDVSDPASPRLAGEYDLGAGWSQALTDPHAFLSYEPLGILTLPYFSYGSTAGEYSSSLDVFNVGAQGISLRGTIAAPVFSTGYGDYPDTVDRAVIIGNSIYSIAHRSVTVAAADTLDTITVVQVPEAYPFYAVPGGIATGGTGSTGPGIVTTATGTL